MLQAPTLKFLKDLKKNNNKPWFEKNKSLYLNAKEDIEHLVGQVIEGFARTDAEIANLQPRDCTYRIYRDVRFSSDKTPYKTNLGAYLSKGGRKTTAAGYYMQVEPGRNMAGGGLWMPAAPELKKVRQEIDYNFEEWSNVIGQRSFRRNFPAGLDKEDILSRPPKGYAGDNPAIEYLKLRSFVVTRTFTDAEAQSKNFAKEIVRTFESMKDFVYFLNRALE
jgi:uncharacterized protein (TIGR02453 family)